MSVLRWFHLRSEASPPRGRQALNLFAASGLVLLQGCAVQAPSCEGRLEPINAPAPVHDTPAKEDRSVERDADDE